MPRPYPLNQLPRLQKLWMAANEQRCFARQASFHVISQSRLVIAGRLSEKKVKGVGDGKGGLRTAKKS